MSVHTTDMVTVDSLSRGQVDTLRLFAVNGFDCKLYGVNPYSRALMCECYDTHPIMRGIGTFTVIAVDGDVYCPYPQ